MTGTSTQDRPISSFRSQIAVVAGSAVIGQVIVAASAPLVSRLFTPADFGVSAGYAFVLTILLAINSLRYEFAIPLPKSDREASNLTMMTLVLVLALSLVFTAVVWGFADQIAALLNEPGIKALLPVLPFGLICGGFVLAFNYWLTRRRQFATISAAQIGSNLAQVTSQIIAGVGQLGALGLAISFVIGQFVQLVIMARRALPLRAIQPRQWLPLALQHKNFPLFTTTASLVDIAGTNLPSVMFLAFFSATEAGYFALTMRMMSLPSAIISSAVAQTIYPRLSEVRDDSASLQVLFERVASSLLLLALTGFGFVLVAGDTLFALVFGEQWTAAGRYAQMLAPFFMMSFVSSPLSSLTLVINRQKVGLGFSLTVTSLRAGALVLGGILQSTDLAVALFTIVSFAIYLAYFVWLTHLAGTPFVSWLWNVRLYVAGVVLLSVSGFATKTHFAPSVHLVLLGALFGGIGLVVIRKLYQGIP